MIKKLKNPISILLIIMLLFSQCNFIFADESSSIDHVVVEVGSDLVILPIGEYAEAIATGPESQLFNYMAPSGAPLVNAIQSGNKFIGIGTYSDTYANLNSISGAIDSAPGLGEEIIKTFKILDGFDDEGNPILTSLFPTYTVAFNIIDGSGSITAKIGDNYISSGDSIEAGSTIIFAVLPAEGFRVAEWKVNENTIVGEKESTYTYSNLDEDINVSVILEEYEILPTPYLWLDAHDYNETTGIWSDKSGNNNIVKQDNASRKPQLVADEFNERPAVRFNGANQFLNLNWENDALACDSLTMFLVIKSNRASGTAETVLGNYDKEDQVVIHRSANSPYSFTAGISTPVRDNRVTFTSETGPHTLTFIYDHDTNKHTPYVNGIIGTSKTKNVAINWINTTIGKNGSDDSVVKDAYWNGDIAEIRVYDIALSDTERRAVEAELDSKWFGPLDPEPVSDIIFSAVPGLREGSASVTIGSTIGTLSTVDGIGAITYSLVSGSGDSDNNCFQISGGQIKVNHSALTQGSYSFRVKAEDTENNFVEKSFSIIVDEEQNMLTDGMALWLDAWDYNADTGVWLDKTDRNTVKQDNSSNRPQLITDGLNGQPVVRFDGSKQFLNLNWKDGAFKTNFTIFMVMKNNDMKKSTQVALGNHNESNQISICVSSQDANLVARIGNYSHSCTLSSESGPYVVAFSYNSSSMKTYLDGTLTDSHSYSTSIDWKTTAIGKSGAGASGYYWAGDIAEIIIYDNVLSDIDHQLVEEYLSRKWLAPEEYSVSFSNPENGSLSASVDGVMINSGSLVLGKKK